MPEQLDAPPELLLAVLDPSEREQARNRRTPQARRAYAIAHACLREVLAAEIGIDPGEVAFVRPEGYHGKPALADPGHGLAFNLSHTQGLVLIGIARGCEVGVDAEWLGRPLPKMALARKYFTDSELTELSTVAPDRRVRGFLQLWTRREAHAKMTGEGLRRAATYTPEGPFGGTESCIYDLDLAPEHVGALAVQARPPSSPRAARVA